MPQPDSSNQTDPQGSSSGDDKLWFMGGAPELQGGTQFARQLANGEFVQRPVASDGTTPSDAPRLRAIGLDDLGPLPDPSPCFGRGTGWTDDQWKKFDKAQKTEADLQESAAGRLESAASALESGQVGPQETATMKRFEEKVGQGNVTPDTMRHVASMYRGNVGALRAGTDQGYVANAYSADEWGKILNGPDPLPQNALAGMRPNTKIMLVNRDHPAFNDFKSLQWATGHEPFHGVNGLEDQIVDGEKAYKYAHDGIYFNRLRTRDPLRAARNPDNLNDFAN